MRRAISLAVIAAMTLVVFAMPATATVHEITGMFCAGEGGGNHFPPGISGESHADNFAKPLFASKFILSVEAFDDGVNGPGMLINFDLDHPASKLAPHPTLDTFFFGDGTYVTAFVLDESHGFHNCKNLRSS